MNTLTPISRFWLLITLWMIGCAGSPEPIVDDEPLTTNAEIYTRLSELPRHYEGTFEWNEGGGTQHVEIWFESVRVSEEGDFWEAEGRGVYQTNRVTKIEIRARIDPNHSRFRMWESNPDTSNFVTNGHHVGRTSKEFRRIRATWKGDDGSSGTLELRAVDEEDEPL